MESVNLNTTTEHHWSFAFGNQSTYQYLLEDKLQVTLEVCPLVNIDMCFDFSDILFFIPQDNYN